MRPFNNAARRLLPGSHRRLTLLIAVAAWTGAARGQSAALAAGEAPVFLRPAPSLSLSGKPSAVPIVIAESGGLVTDLRIARQLSAATKPAAAVVQPEPAPAPLRATATLARTHQPSLRPPETEASGAAPPLRLAAQLAERAPPAAAREHAYPGTSAAFAGARAAQPEAPLDVDEVLPGPPATPSAGPGALPELPDLGFAGWTVPPIRWGGNTGSTYIYNTNFEGNDSLSDTMLMNGRASSYIYAPWLAQVTASAGLSTSGSRFKTADSTSKSESTSINYGGNLNLFPVSRFPFSAYVEAGDSRAKASTETSATAASTQYSSVRLGARQSYRPEAGNASYSGSADHSSVTSGTANSVVNSFQGGFSNNFEDHGLSANARFSTTTGDIGGQGSTLFNANGSHNWQIPEEGLTISNSASLSSNDLKTLSLAGNGLTTNNSRVLQASSSFNWLPDEELPLTISGGIGLLNLATTTEAAETSLLNLNSFINASYRIDNNLSASGGVTIASTSSTNKGLAQQSPLESAAAGTPARNITTSQRAALSYMGDPLIFGDYSYNWGGSASLANFTSTFGGAGQNLGASGQHSLTTSIPLSETSMLALNASQSVGLNSSTASGGGGSSNQNTTLTHSVGAVWRSNVGQVSVATLSASASDTMGSGNFSNHLRSFHADGRLQTQLSSRAALNAALNASASQQLSSPNNFTFTTTTFGTTTTTAPTTIWSGSGQVFFSYRSPFDIANLFYTASFSANANQTNLRVVSGDVNALSWQTSRVFSNQLVYRIGRLSFQATGSMAWIGDGKKNATVFGSVSRELGDF